MSEHPIFTPKYEFLNIIHKSETLSTLTSALGPLVIGSWGLLLPPFQHVNRREEIGFGSMAGKGGPRPWEGGRAGLEARES